MYDKHHFKSSDFNDGKWLWSIMIKLCCSIRGKKDDNVQVFNYKRICCVLIEFPFYLFGVTTMVLGGSYLLPCISTLMKYYGSSHFFF